MEAWRQISTYSKPRHKMKDRIIARRLGRKRLSLSRLDPYSL
jgi:hypothetical protein